MQEFIRALANNPKMWKELNHRVADKRIAYRRKGNKPKRVRKAK